MNTLTTSVVTEAHIRFSRLDDAIVLGGAHQRGQRQRTQYHPCRLYLKIRGATTHLCRPPMRSSPNITRGVISRAAREANAPIRNWPCYAGDILLIHPKTIHASLPQRSGTASRRIALTTRWLGDDVVRAPKALTIKIPALESLGVMQPGRPPPDFHFPVLCDAECKLSATNASHVWSHARNVQHSRLV